jgi:CrcB protein
VNAAILLSVCGAGGVGAAARFVLDGLIRAWLTSTYPVGTMLINVTGSLLLGLFAGLTLGQALPQAWQTIAGTGFLGGYTTFSTASFETVRLLEERRLAAALVNGIGMLVVGVAAACLGLVVGLAL